MASEGATESTEEHLAAFVVVATQIVATTMASMGRHGVEIARTLWPAGGAPRAHTWDGLVARALEHARERRLAEASVALEQLGPSVIDTALAEEQAERAAKIEELFETSGRLLFEWCERIQDAPDHHPRWVLARATAVLQLDVLVRARAVLALLDDPDALLEPLDRMLAKAEELIAACASPEQLPPADPRDTELLLRQGAAERERLSVQLAIEERDESDDAAEPERAPEETLARLERVVCELTAIATRLGAHVDRVLFGGAPPAASFVVLLEAIDARLGMESDGRVLETTAALDTALLASGPPEPGTESLLRRAAERLATSSEAIREAGSPERAMEIAQVAEALLRLVAAHAVGIATGTGEETLAAPLARLLGIEPSDDAIE